MGYESLGCANIGASGVFFVSRISRADLETHRLETYSKESNMLVLTRRSGEEIVVGGNVRITVVAVKGDRVRIGVAAPRNVSVDRKEIHDRRAEFAVENDPPANGYLFYDDHSIADCCPKG